MTKKVKNKMEGDKQKTEKKGGVFGWRPGPSKWL